MYTLSTSYKKSRSIPGATEDYLYKKILKGSVKPMPMPQNEESALKIEKRCWHYPRKATHNGRLLFE